MFGFDNQFSLRIILLIQMDCNLVKGRRSQHVIRRAGTSRVETHHREDSPRGHRAGVFVARDTVRGIVVASLQDIAHFLLGTPSFTFEVAEKVRIGNVRFVRRVIVAVIEDALELCHELLVAAHQLSQALDIVGDIEGVVPSIALVEAGARFEVRALFRVERFVELTIWQNRTKRTEVLAIIVLIAHRTVVEQLSIILLTQGFGKLAQVPVGNIILQRVGYRIVILFPQRNVAQREVIVSIRTEEIVLARSRRTLAHGFVCRFHIKVLKPFHPCIYDIRDRWVALHSKGLPTVKLPLRQPAILLVHFNHCMDNL